MSDSLFIEPPIIRRPSLGGRVLPLLLDSPHSALLFPSYAYAKRSSILRSDRHFFHRYADLFVDDLIGLAPRLGASVVMARYARSFVDLNRESDDISDGQLGAGLFGSGGVGVDDGHDGHGLSLFWRRVQGIDLWSTISQLEADRRLRWIWGAYHDCLSEILFSMRDEFGFAFLLNCHSMPCVASGIDGYHVVLGDAHGLSCDRVLGELVMEFFASHGLRVRFNEPFSGGSIIRRHGMVASGISALQIEIRRDLYMDERNFIKSENFSAIQTLFMRLVEHVGDYCSYYGAGFLGAAE